MLQDSLTSTGNVGKNEGLGLGIPVEEMTFGLWSNKDGDQSIIFLPVLFCLASLKISTPFLVLWGARA